LPLGVTLASKNVSVTAYDNDKKSVDLVAKGTPHFYEPGLKELLNESMGNKSFKASNDPGVLRKADTIIIVIGTPIDQHQNPDPNTVVNVVEELIPYFCENQLIILRSTVFPGVTKRVKEMINEYFSTIVVSFCPERISEGNAIKELRNLPQIIGADDDLAFERSENLFSTLGVEMVRLSTEEAELAKLFSNVWRYLKFAITNELFIISESAGLNYEKIRNAMSYKYPRALDIPKAGFAAGPCLVKDTAAVISYSGNLFKIGVEAININEGLPLHLVNKLKQEFDLSKEVVGILGMSFKPEVDDIRSSLSFKLRKYLLFYCKDVLMSDPFVSDERNLELDHVIEASTIIIIATPHKIYKDLKSSKPIINIFES
jgi:UDP-N-acetyl-D-mannosaminuronic acid dehydrogenase